MTYEIRQTENGRYALIVNGQFIADYARRFTAKRGLERFLASHNIQPDLLTELKPVSEAGEVCADAQADSREAAADCAAVQSPPASNTGGLPHTDGGAAVSTVSRQFVMVNGKPKEIPLRVGLGTAAHIDTLTFTVPVGVFHVSGQYEQLPTSEEEHEIMLANAQTLFESLFGFGFSARGNGINGYKHSAVFGIAADERIKYGFFAWGSANEKQANTVCVHLSGVGLTAAADGWETRLYQWIKQDAPNTRITRCDLAHDFLQGEYTPQQAYCDWKAGGFTTVQTRPNAELAGAGWLNPQGGRTLYIGSKKNGSRLVRVYEKGIEQGDPQSPWVRFELQLRNRDIVIEHEILIQPGQYLTGAYPICQTLFTQHNEDTKKNERIKLMKEINIEHVVRYASIQVSPCIKMLKSLGFSKEEVCDIIENEAAKLPKRLHPNAFDCNFPFEQFLKENKHRPTDIELADYACRQYLSQHPPKVPTEQERQQNQKRLQQQQYLECVFGNKPYNYDIHGCDYETYLHRRYSSILPTPKTERPTQ